jgi:hypothetical protein
VPPDQPAGGGGKLPPGWWKGDSCRVVLEILSWSPPKGALPLANFCIEYGKLELSRTQGMAAFRINVRRLVPEMEKIDRVQHQPAFSLN